MSRPLKILFLLHVPPPVHGSSVVGLAIKESKTINEAFDCTYINLLASQHVAESGKVSLRKLVGFVGTFVKLFGTLVSKRPQVCYLALTATGIGLYKDMLLVALLKVFRIKRIYHLHNKGVNRYQDKKVHRFIYQFVFKGAGVILLSKHLYTDIARFVPIEKVHICPNGIADESGRRREGEKGREGVPIPIAIGTIGREREARNNIEYPITNGQYSIDKEQYPLTNDQYPIDKEQYQITNDQYQITNDQYAIDKDQQPTANILFLSNLIESKGVWVLLEACACLKRNKTAFKLVLIGGEGDITEAQFNRRVKEMGLSDVVKYEGKKYGREKGAAFAAADIFAFPTYYHNETFGLVNIEAMSWSLPVVSTFEGGIPDVVEDGVTGFLVPQQNAALLSERLEWLINNPALRQQMGAAGRRKYEQEFTLERFEERMVEILERAREREGEKT